MSSAAFTPSNKSKLGLIPGYLLLIIWLVFCAILIGWVFLASLSTTKGIFSNNLLESGLHFENYYQALFKQKFINYFGNSVLYTVISCLGVILIGAPCAYVLARFPFKGSKFIRLMFVASLGIPQVMLILPIYTLSANLDILNTRFILLVLYIGLNIPFTVFFLLSFFSTQSKAIEEAAAIDGCSPTKTFWSIMLPLAQPGIITVTIFNFIVIWNEFFMALIFANQTELRPLALGLYTMVQSMRYSGDWAGMFAAVVVVLLPTVLLYVFLSEKIVAGITGGAVKG